MAEPIVIPDRAAFKASEVCELLGVAPYVLRSWENEFPDLGLSRSPGGGRLYRKQDVERAAQIRGLVVDEGLTLAGVRRRLEQTAPEPTAEQELAAMVGEVAPEPVDVRLRAHVRRVRDELRDLHEQLVQEPVVRIPETPGRPSQQDLDLRGEPEPESSDRPRKRPARRRSIV